MVVKLYQDNTISRRNKNLTMFILSELLISAQQFKFVQIQIRHCTHHQALSLSPIIQIQQLMKGQQSYIASIRAALDISLCLRDFPSTLFEKDNKPYVELNGYNNNNKIDTLIAKPIYLARSKKEQFLIEPSINSCRISFTLKKNDEIDRLIANKFSTMAASRAEAFEVMRRKAIKDYDVTLLITNEILERYNKDFIIQLILNLVGTLQKDLLEVKLNINTQCRIASTFFIDQLSNPPNQQYW